MSSQQSNQSNNCNKIEYSPHYQPQTSNRMQVHTNDILTSNLDLYIPRVASNATEEQVKSIFFHSRIGTVEHCDFAITKDKDTQKPQYTSAFVKLSCWSPTSGACEDFVKNKSIRLQLSRNSPEFWIILPNTNPLPRSHVNTSQLAAATEKLFSQTEQITEKASKFEDEMRATISEMRQMMALQQEKIETLEFQLTMTLVDQSPEIFDIKPEPVVPLVEPLAKTLERDFDAEVDELLDTPLQWQIIDHTFSKSDDDDDEVNELFRMPPLLTRSMSVSNYNEEDECIFSNREVRGQLREPVLKSGSQKMMTLGEIAAENPERAIGSSCLCGNL
jgi:hypothetical protein